MSNRIVRRGLRKAWFALWAALSLTAVVHWLSGCAVSSLVPSVVLPPGSEAPPLPLDAVAHYIELHDAGFSRCSAVAVSPTLALTAKHCIGPDWLGATLSLPDGSEYGIEAVSLPSSGADIAVVRVAGELPAWAELAPGRPLEGELAWVAGYGCPPALLAVRPATYVGEFGDSLGLLGVACPGDSGGPLFDGQGRVLGVNVRRGELPDGTPVVRSTAVDAAAEPLTALGFQP